MEPIAQPQIPRDARVDLVGYVQELQSHWSDPLKKQIKAGLVSGDRVQGDLFQGLMSGGNGSETIDAGKFYKLFTSKKLTLAQFLSAVAVSVKRARELLSETDLEKVKGPTKPSEPSFTIKRKDGVEVALVDAVRETSRHINEAKAAKAAAAA